MGIIFGWLAGLLALIGFQFYWWRSLRTDYDQITMVGIGWLAGLVYILGGVLGAVGLGGEVGNALGWWNSLNFRPVWGLVLAQIMVVWVAWLRDWKIWPMAEDVMAGFYGLTAFIQVVQIFFSGSLVDLGITVVAFGLYRYMRANYRRWSWYSSGKKGFVFFALNAIYFAGMAVNWGLSGSGGLEVGKAIAAGVMSLILGGGLFMLGRQ